MSTVKLNTGSAIPRIGYGVGTAWFGRKGVDNQLKDAVLTALKTGYTHLDLAEVYGNHETIGAALKEWNGKREDLWITDKILPGMADIRGTLEKQLKTLGTDYIDLYLLHAPEKRFPKGSPTQEEAWLELEKLHSEGLLKNIGVSNHRVQDIERILKSGGKVVPAANQIELHPLVYKEAKEIIDFCHDKGIKIEAYSPTATMVHFTGTQVDSAVEKAVKSLGERAGKTVTPGQILLKWAAQKGDISVTTSGKESRMKEQLEAFNLPDLSEGEVNAIEQAGLNSPFKRKYMVEVFTD